MMIIMRGHRGHRLHEVTGKELLVTNYNNLFLYAK